MHTEVEGITTWPTAALPAPAGLCVHLIGIGGAGMSAAASMLLELGAKVSGSDLESFDGLGNLVAAGARVSVGHHETQLAPDADLVVASAAIPESNPELVAARACGMRVIKYAELLGLLMADRCGMAIAGTHGKSTTSAMVVHILRQAGLDPSFVIGARSSQLGGGGGVGCGRHLIVEACEYDRSFLHLQPESAAILNLEPDHLDCFGDLDGVIEAFCRFAERVEPTGLLVCNAEDERVIQASRSATAMVETFGVESPANWQAVHLRSDRGAYAFDVLFNHQRVLTTRLNVPGKYNVANALAATALAYHAGADPEGIGQALATFEGLDRRMSWRGKGEGVTILDDYAHHPTEIRVTIEAAKNRYQPRRTWVIFQPHQTSRTHHFMDQFASALSRIDEIIIPDVYGARESDAQACKAGSQELALRIRKLGGHARYLPSFEAVTDHLLEHIAEGDLVMTMGAGDVWRIADELVERLCRSD